MQLAVVQHLGDGGQPAVAAGPQRPYLHPSGRTRKGIEVVWVTLEEKVTELHNSYGLVEMSKKNIKVEG